MSQQRTRTGRKVAPAGEAHHGSTPGEPRRTQAQLQEVEDQRTQVSEVAQQRHARGSAVHSILNPSTSTQGGPSYSSGSPPTRGSNVEGWSARPFHETSSAVGSSFGSQEQRPDHARTTQTYLGQSNISGQGYRQSGFAVPLSPSSSSNRPLRPGDRTDTLMPETSIGAHHPTYGQNPLSQRLDSRAAREDVFASGTRRPFSSAAYLDRGQPVDPATSVTYSPRNLTLPQTQAPGTGASNLATGVGQLTIGRTPDTSGQPPARGAYRYHTMNTEQGPVSFPLEVQTASRVADEKRRRNAGASARFRARRKEREQASSREIEGLRQQIQDLEDDVNFYRGERDFLAAELYTSPGSGRHFPRPTSPRRQRPLRPRRLTETLSAGSSSREDAAPPYQELGGRAATERYARRRLSQSTHEGLLEPAVRTESMPYPPQQALPYQVPQQGHSYGPVQSNPHYPAEYSPYEAHRPPYFRPPSSSPPPPTRPPTTSGPDWSQSGRYKTS